MLGFQTLDASALACGVAQDGAGEAGPEAIGASGEVVAARAE